MYNIPRHHRVMRLISGLHLIAVLLLLKAVLTCDAQGMQGRLRGIKDGSSQKKHNMMHK